jgi:hypothetical protein
MRMNLSWRETWVSKSFDVEIKKYQARLECNCVGHESTKAGQNGDG